MRANRPVLRTATLTAGALVALAVPVTTASANAAPARADNVHSRAAGYATARPAAAPADSSGGLLIAAGAGVAATGAASLAFALYRRDDHR
ncbi:hypothetical protein ABT127_34935 [Streptomyces sp. NPDC001904]|uniref:hypothetical protein n=1 Tax=Streptomyces sp. NPDC001904 TaxID=3154531 RepID=UPI00332E1118